MIKDTIGGLLENFKEQVTNFQSNQAEYKEKVENKIKRQLNIIDGDMDPEELEEALRNPEILKNKIQNKLVGNAHFSLVNAV